MTFRRGGNEEERKIPKIQQPQEKETLTSNPLQAVPIET
jgi:hypothetical protein